MSKITIADPGTRKKIIPLVMGIANMIIEKLEFVKKINEAVKWDQRHWNISPGGLLKVLILSTFTDMRVPLSHLEERMEGIDVEIFLEAGDKSSFVNESNVGEALDRLGEVEYERMYETMALSAVKEYKIPIRKMHSDTTTISFYGDYDAEKLKLSEEEKEVVLSIERGYNKDGRAGCKQAVVGQITNESGIPLVSRTLDGGTSDIDWNREAIKYAADIAKSGFEEGIYVADSKLVIEEHITTMNDPAKRVQFVSRCPANFKDKLESRTIKKAYEKCAWNTMGSISDVKGATQYKGISFVEEICGAPMRLLVLESDELLNKAHQTVAKKEEELILLIKALEKQEWMCRADAEIERERFLSLKQLSIFECEVRIEMQTIEKWSPGRRSAKTKPTIIETYHLCVEKVTKSESAYQEFIQNESCIVLISNVVTGMDDKDLLRTYKGQQVVENSFRDLKSPHLASVIYLHNPKRIQVLTMLLTFSLLIRALIQFRLREGFKQFKQTNPGIEIRAGWGGRPLNNPTFKLFYEHSVNCCFERDSHRNYCFSWPSVETKSRVEPLLVLLGISLQQILP